MRITICLLTLSVALACPLTAGAKTRTVALHGQAAPGTLTTFSYFEAPKLNDSGDTAVRGITSIGPAGVWSESGKSLGLAARGEQRLGDLELYSPKTQEFNSSGRLAFWDSTYDYVTGNWESTAWSKGAGQPSPVARDGASAAPAMPTGSFWMNTSTLLRLNENNQTAIYSGLTGAGRFSSDRGVWIDTAGTRTLAAVTGQDALALGAGAKLATIEPPRFNDSGSIAFTGGGEGDGIGSANDHAVWLSRGGVLSLVAREGSQAPDALPGHNFQRGYYGLAVNNQDAVAFTTYAGLAATGSRLGVWAGEKGALRRVVGGGVNEVVPGLGVGDTLYDTRSLLLNDAGHVAFQGRISGGLNIVSANDSGIWSEGSGSLELIAREGNLAPGTGGLSFGQLYQSATDLAMNEHGQVAFLAHLTDDQQSQAGVGLFAESVAGDLELIAQSGGILEVAPGDYREIEWLTFAGGSGGSDGTSDGFNSRGEVAFYAEFVDGSNGVFVSQTSTSVVPEPTAITIACMAGLSVARLRHRRH